MKLRYIIFLTIFLIGVTPLLTLVAINLRGHISRHEEVEHKRLLAQSKLLQGTLLNSISHLGGDPSVFIPEYADCIWVDEKGLYRHIPEHFQFPTPKKERTTATAISLFSDFPEIKERMADQEPFLLTVNKRVFSWLPIPESNSDTTIFWIGKELDTSGAQQWKRSLIQNILFIVISTMVAVFFIARMVASKVDRWQKDLLSGLNTVLNKEENVSFSWHGPKEVKELGRDLSSLCSQYIESRKNSRRSSMELKESENRFRKLTASAQDAIIMMDNDGNTAFWNKAAETIFGHSSEEVIGKPIHSLLDLRRHDIPDAQTSFTRDKNDRTSSPGQGKIIELIARRKNGEDIIIELSLSAARIDNQWHAIWIARDISERKKNEREAELRQQQLLQADKMHSLGLLVSGMAHEINNPNSITILNSSMLANAWKSVTPILDEYATDNGDFLVAGLEYSEMREQVPRLFEELEESCKRVRNIVKDLKDYSRQETSKVSDYVDLNVVIEKAVRLTKNQISKATSNFSFLPSPKLPAIKGNQQRLEQVVINLIQNACESLKRNSASVTIKTGYNETDKTVWLCVEDQGCGISKEAMQQIVDPFFTTKRDFGGTGLGLSVSAGIIKRHNGTINFLSEPDSGTKVTVSFPAAEDSKAIAPQGKI